MKLLTGSRNYSSWTMRVWLVMRYFDISFEELRISLNKPDTAERIGQYSPSRRIPCLVLPNQVIWDSLAICEYLAESFPEGKLWPSSASVRAHARSVCAEMHADFHEMRHAMPFDIRARRIGTGAKALAREGVRNDIKRIEQIWETCLSQYGGPFLFGQFTIADAYFAPVVLRFRTYGIGASSEKTAKYMRHIESLAPVREWVNTKFGD